MKICIAGASGFVGRALIQELLTKTPHTVVGLSRHEKEATGPDSRLSWRSCDLFSMLDVEKGLDGADIAIYLVHSMLPSANLVQGTFEDFDLVLADNFAKAASKKGIKQVIYLGGIIPDQIKLSPHLRSRLEVENILSSYVSTTCLRAGLVIGPGGSSFRIMFNLVRRLPMMVCPSWTSTISAPVALPDVVHSIVHCVGNPMAMSKVFDLGEEPFVSYRVMMSDLAVLMGLKRYILSVPFVSITVSKLWVMLITGAPKNLVYPLIQSLSSTMTPRPQNRLVIPNFKWKTPKEALAYTLKKENLKELPHAFKRVPYSADKDVRSVQRIIPIHPVSAQDIAQEYFKWLPWFFQPFIKVVVKGHITEFRAPFIRPPLLRLIFSPERSTVDRQLFYIRGGLLAYGKGRGRLEFRNFLDRKITIAAIHEFRPRLPWFVYKYTQALIHLFTMNAFKKHFLKLQKRQPDVSKN